MPQAGNPYVGTLESCAPYVVMEYLSGEDLDQLLLREGRMSVSAATDVALQACEAIAEAHSSASGRRSGRKPSP